ncbi:Ail/Lom family outer membrane beta-barrel protein [Escherichia coli]|uniref:Ail/Lom family outer membrane beta-barrel protein n=1 Tax=Escherichia coli TaxID=562 RepID=UPI000CFB7251|nr:Ail/Lom family outer membrane beta-barrel protein [Escherichia coli]
MKNSLLSVFALLASGVVTVPAVQADTHSVSLGFAQTRIEHFKNVQGINLKYHYESDFPVGLMASFSWQTGDWDYSERFSDGSGWDDDIKVKYGSILVGPSARLNEYLALYGLIGAGVIKAETTDYFFMPDYREHSRISERKTGLAWGAGIQFNPVENFVIDAGYEGSKINDIHMHGFNIGIGYRF